MTLNASAKALIFQIKIFCSKSRQNAETRCWQRLGRRHTYFPTGLSTAFVDEVFAAKRRCAQKISASWPAASVRRRLACWTREAVAQEASAREASARGATVTGVRGELAGKQAGLQGEAGEVGNQAVHAIGGQRVHTRNIVHRPSGHLQAGGVGGANKRGIAACLMRA